MDDWVKEKLEQVIWGAAAEPLWSGPPAGTEPLSIPHALSRALIVVYRSEIEELRAALGRIQAGSTIEKKLARLDLLEARVTAMEHELEKR